MKNVIIINAYINTEEKENVLYKSLLQLKKLELPILIIASSILSTRIVELCDYYIYDEENFLLPVERSPLYWYADGSESIHLYNRGIGYLIIKRLNLALHFVKNLGFNNFFYSEYDSIFHDDDLGKIKNIFASLNIKKAFLCQVDSSWLESRMFAGNVDFFLDNIPMPTSYEEWISTEPYASNSETLEMIFPILFKNFASEIETAQGYNKDYFANSQIDLFSISKEVNIVYNEENKNNPLLFLLGTNRTYDVWINEKHIETIYLETGQTKKYYFDISTEEVVIKVQRDGLESVFTVNTDNICDYKLLGKRFNL